jgi:hypothetical protein
VLICSDHPDATAAAAELVTKIPNMRPLDAGGLSLATPIESFTAVLLQLNVHYKTRVAVKFTGIPDGADQKASTPPNSTAGGKQSDAKAAAPSEPGPSA